MAKYKSVVIPIAVDAGTRGNATTVTTEAGFIRRAVIAHGTADNSGMVRATIEGINGEKLAQMQALEIYRTRNIGYSEDGVPLNVGGGNQMTFKILATEDFNQDFVADLVLIYDEEENC